MAENSLELENSIKKTKPVNNRLRILFVCSLNRWRSPTAEMLYRSDPRLSVKSAGVSSSAKHLISDADVQWAEVIFVMERGHKARIQERFRDSELPPIEVLDIPETLQYMDPELQRLLRLAIDPEINALLAARDAGSSTADENPEN